MKIKLLLIVFFVTLLVGCSSGASSSVGTDQTTQEGIDKAISETVVDEPNYIKPGMYKIGSDLSAGEYVIWGTGYMQISKDSSGTMDSIISNNLYTNLTYVTVSDGQYFSFDSGECYTLSDSPMLDPARKKLDGGMFLVGRDIPAGEYKIYSEGGSYYEVTTNSKHSMDSIKANSVFDTDQYLTVKDGEYLTLTGCWIEL